MLPIPLQPKTQSLVLFILIHSVMSAAHSTLPVLVAMAATVMVAQVRLLLRRVRKETPSPRGARRNPRTHTRRRRTLRHPDLDVVNLTPQRVVANVLLGEELFKLLPQIAVERRISIPLAMALVAVLQQVQLLEDCGSKVDRFVLVLIGDCIAEHIHVDGHGLFVSALRRVE